MRSTIEDLAWNRALQEAFDMGLEETPAMKVFTPKNRNLQILEEYPIGEDLGEEYCRGWYNNPYKPDRGSFMDHTQIERIADEVGYKRRLKMKEIITNLRDGADLGITGEGRWPSVGVNNPSVAQYGERVADSLQSGILQGYIYGPIKEEDLPWFEVKVAPMTVRLKPNGTARIIIDLGWPRGRLFVLGNGVPISPTQAWKAGWSLRKSP